MEHADLARLLRAALTKHSRLKRVTVKDDDRLNGSIGLDSFALLSALLDVEDELDVEIDQSRLADVRDMTFVQLVGLLAETCAAALPSGSATEAAP